MFCIFKPPCCLLCLFSSACHSSCASCWGPAVSQCTLCAGGLFLHQGQCVEACGEGLYSQDNTCQSKSFSHVYSVLKHLYKWFMDFPPLPLRPLFDLSSPLRPDCHPTCRSCVGPLASDCLRCIKPEEALLLQSSHLQQGVCTAGCPAHSFLDDMQTCRGECTEVFGLISVLSKRNNNLKGLAGVSAVYGRVF